MNFVDDLKKSLKQRFRSLCLKCSKIAFSPWKCPRTPPWEKKKRISCMCVLILITYFQLVKVYTIKSKILIVNWIQCSSHNTSFHFVLFFRQQLQFNIRITKEKKNFLWIRIVLKSNLFQIQHWHIFSSYFPPTFEFLNPLL